MFYEENYINTQSKCFFLYTSSITSFLCFIFISCKNCDFSAPADGNKEDPSAPREYNFEMSSIKPQVIDASSCPIDVVTVFLDRAEVVRSLNFKAVPGENEIVVIALSHSIDPQSIRVKAIGECQILDVSYDSSMKTIEPDKNDNSTAIAAFSKTLAEFEKKKDSLTKQATRNKLAKKLIQSYVDSALSVNGSTPKIATATLDDAKATITFYTSEMERLDDEEMKLADLLDEVRKNIELTNHELNKIRGASSITYNTTRSISIVINALTAHDNMQLQVSYVVFNATWVPSYDLRVSSSQSTMDVTYYAEVKQTTNENWNDCKLILSTSNPAIGAAPPPLPSRKVTFFVPTISYNSYGRSLASKKRSEEDEDSYVERASFSALEDFQNESSAGGGGVMRSLALGAAARPPPPPTATAQGSGDAGSTVFQIARKVNILSDSKPHRVTVTTTSFPTQTVHYAAPAAAAIAYIQAKTMNTSQYPMLASDKVSVFFDGVYVATTSLKQANTGESFNVFLGADPAVKVEYLPARTEESAKGWMSGTTQRKVFYSTVLTNTKKQVVKLILADILPRSPDEKIVVELIEPAATSLAKATDNAASGNAVSEQDIFSNVLSSDLSEGASSGASGMLWAKDSITQNKYTNNIIWFKTLQPGEKIEIKFTYRISYPQGQTIVIQ